MAPSTASKGIADTFTRLLRLTLKAEPTLSSLQLMEASEAHLAEIARRGSSREQLIAARILDSPREYRRWESEHARLMDNIAGMNRPGLQVRATLSACFSLTHRKALFETLREQSLRGNARRRLVAHFHGGFSYSQAMVAEHGNYLRSSVSLFCTDHIGETLLKHASFGEPLRGYEQLYGEYFRTYCASLIAPPGESDTSVQALLPHLKQDVLAVRTRLLSTPAPGARPVRGAR